MKVFKPGDWVISTKYPKANPIKIQHQHAIDTGIFGTYTNTKGQANLLYSEECMPWQPKVSEWCWFWNQSDINLSISPHIGQYGNLSYSLEFYDNCEPFIGQLPTSIKDQS